jgi:UDP-N-acetylmuramate dehydrogenase
MMTIDKILRDEIELRFGNAMIVDEPLSKHTTFGVGGPASIYLEVHTKQEMKDAVSICQRHDADYFVIGGGSNLLVSDDGFYGVIIRCAIDHFVQDGNRITVGGGFDLDTFVEKACELGLGGVQMLAGIKGTIGGAIFGNAGAYGGAISDHFVSAALLRPRSDERTENKYYFEFSYRDSILKRTREVVLEATFELTGEDTAQLQKERLDILEQRSKKHPETDCSAGCFFRNIEKPDEEHGKLAAGYLLEQVGAKTLRVGNAGVYENHANILVNLGGATADDIRKLAMELKKMVRNKSGYDLDEEITYLGNFN